jgi:hypothetical protein
MRQKPIPKVATANPVQQPKPKVRTKKPKPPPIQTQPKLTRKQAAEQGIQLPSVNRDPPDPELLRRRARSKSKSRSPKSRSESPKKRDVVTPIPPKGELAVTFADGPNDSKMGKPFRNVTKPTPFKDRIVRKENKHVIKSQAEVDKEKAVAEYKAMGMDYFSPSDDSDLEDVDLGKTDITQPEGSLVPVKMSEFAADAYAAAGLDLDNPVVQADLDDQGFQEVEHRKKKKKKKKKANKKAQKMMKRQNVCTQLSPRDLLAKTLPGFFSPTQDSSSDSTNQSSSNSSPASTTSPTNVEDSNRYAVLQHEDEKEDGTNTGLSLETIGLNSPQRPIPQGIKDNVDKGTEDPETKVQDADKTDETKPPVNPDPNVTQSSTTHDADAEQTTYASIANSRTVPPQDSSIKDTSTKDFQEAGSK